MSSKPKNADEIVDEALTLPESERPTFIDKACGSNQRLREIVEGLMKAFGGAGKAHQAIPSIGPTERLGTVIGRYKLLEIIGEGGFGMVYMAEQREPVKRRVALKILKPGMDSRQVVARFEAERQALALMDHPNIAKVLDGGATEAGRPYFVMELVRGIKITDYCDQNNLPTAARLKLFMDVCKAVQHAHQKGIIHRDIKPSNILVTLHDGVPVPKVIDFGIAKATQQELTDKTLFTAFQQFIGTPAYMSPEQAEMSGLDIDTRSDIYSLGVLLYELLTGHPPFDPKRMVKAGLDEIRRIIREEDPPRPSTRLSTLGADEQTSVAKRRAVELPKLLHQVRGDLDWIVMKCLEKDRTRRYETSLGLSDDLQRCLALEPISARPPSNIYKLHRLVLRNKLAFGAATVVALALIGGFGCSSWMFLREKAAREKAARAENEATAAKNAEKQQRLKAEERELAARLEAYCSDVGYVQRNLWDGKLSQVRFLLNRARPGPGQSDLRGLEWRYFWQLLQKGETAPAKQLSDATQMVDLYRAAVVELPQSVSAISFSTGRAQIICGTARGLFLEHQDGVKRLRTGTNDFVAQTAVFSDDGEWLAASDTNHTVRVWDTATGSELFSLPQFSEDVLQVSFSADKRSLSTLSRTGTLVDWNVEERTKTVTRNLDTHIGTNGEMNPNLFSLSSDHKQYLTVFASAKNELKLVETITGSVRCRFQAHTQVVTAVAFAPGDRLAASAAEDGTTVFWDVESGHQIGTLRDSGKAIAFSPDATRLAILARSTLINGLFAVILYEVETRRQLAVIYVTDLERSCPAEECQVKFSPDGNILAARRLAGNWRFICPPSLAECDGVARPQPALTKSISALLAHLVGTLEEKK